jgi:hypothetical protein
VRRTCRSRIGAAAELAEQVPELKVVVAVVVVVAHTLRRRTLLQAARLSTTQWVLVELLYYTAVGVLAAHRL